MSQWGEDDVCECEDCAAELWDDPDEPFDADALRKVPIETITPIGGVL